MAMIPKTRAGCLDVRERLWKELEQLHGAAGLVHQLKAVQFELDNNIPAGEYGGCVTQEEAILKFLESAGEWTDRLEIGKAVIEGGFQLRGISPKRAASYIGDKAYRMATIQKTLQHIDDRLIGLPGWSKPPLRKS